MSDFVAVYHCWSEPHEPSSYKNARTPVVASIATLRATSDIPIVVLDMTGEETDWGRFPAKLNFQIERRSFYLSQYKELVTGYKHLSRIFDIEKWSSENAKEKTIIYCDSDIFFFKNPFPLAVATDKFCWDGWNTGFFYFKQNDVTYKKFYSLFEKYTLEAIFAESVRQDMKKFVGYDDWYGVWDEMVLGYMKNQHPDVFNTIPNTEHVTCRSISQIKISEAKVFHGNGTFVPHPIQNLNHARGLLCLAIEEFYQQICQYLNQEDLKEIYGQNTLEYFQEKRFNLSDAVDYLEWMKNDKGLYEILKFSQNLKVI
jgi:hypothetical protein